MKRCPKDSYETLPASCINRRAPSRFRHILMALAALLSIATALSACAANNPLIAQTSSYTVHLAIDEPRVGERRALIDIENRNGQPGVIESVSVVPLMRQHGMASPEMVAQQLGDGHYQVDGLLFSMNGDWQLEVYIDRSDAREIATFQINVWP